MLNNRLIIKFNINRTHSIANSAKTNRRCSQQSINAVLDRFPLKNSKYLLVKILLEMTDYSWKFQNSAVWGNTKTRLN